MCFRRSVQLRGRVPVRKGLQLPSCCLAVKMRMTLNFMLSQKNLWPTFTTRGTLTEEVSEQVFSKERRRLQAKHLWMEVKLRWQVLADRMYTKAPTGKSKEELDALLFDRAARLDVTTRTRMKKKHIVVQQTKKSKLGGGNVRTGWHTSKHTARHLFSTSRAF